MKIHFNSIKLKLTFFYTVILLLLLFLFHFIAYMLLSHGLRSDMYDSVEAYTEVVRDTVLSSEGNLLDVLTGLNSSSNNEVFIYDVYTGEVTSSFPVTDDIKSTLSKKVNVGTSTYTQGLTIQEIQTYLHITPLGIDTHPGEMLVVARSVDYIYRTVDSYKQLLYTAVPVIIIFALLSGFLLSGYFLRQVKAITRTAEKIDPSNLVDRIPVKSSDELGRLSGTLNSLFDRIYGFIDRQRRFTADASHDLRAPLTNIKAETSLALRKNRSSQEYRDALKRIDQETEHLNTMVDDLLTLASMDTQPERSRTIMINLSDYIESILNSWESQFAQKGVKLVRRIIPDIEIRGEVLHFSRIVDNLLKNALEYTRAGGEVDCSLELREKDIVITVTDTGIGISANDLPHIFDRFYKVDRDTPGNGLGLPIVEGTVKMYGGSVTAESEFGKGSVFTVTFPAKQPYYITFDD
jgi:signal transduction histidine kinase